MKHPALKIVANGDRELIITRDFHAARRLVFDAHTKPELVQRWLGVFAGWTMPVCEIDLRVGGRYRYGWRGPDGSAMGMGGVYREIVPSERLVATEAFDESWYPGDAVNTQVFVENAGITTMTITTVYATKEARDVVLKSPMEQGMSAGYEGLDVLLTKQGVRA